MATTTIPYFRIAKITSPNKLRITIKTGPKANGTKILTWVKGFMFQS
jgi:hypothetical protein